MSDLRSEAARELGRARTPRKQKAVRENLAMARQSRWTDEAKEAHAQKMRAIWERRRTEKTVKQPSDGLLEIE